ncbi:phage holin family protein [Gibbsiella dentisursi]|uniref:Phage holin family protein n=1 Tax=Gibbsiella dentisursi TaxID=796890 RepID=A0ABP7M3M6_9GAMM
MILQELLLNANAMICAAASLRLLTFRRGKSRHNRPIAFISWLLTVATGAVTIRVLTGEYFYTDWTEVLINLLLCAAIFRSRGNVGKLLKANHYESQ